MSISEPSQGTRSERTHSSWESQEEPPSERFSDRATRLSQKIADAALERINDARQRAESGFEQHRGRVANTLDRMTRAIEFVSAEVVAEDKLVSEYLDATGARTRRVASYVSSATPNRLVEDVSKLARKRPAAVVAGSFLAGLMIGRFLHASEGS